jgi:hypothetical protein
MSALLRRIIFDESFEYEIEKEKQVYSVKISKVKMNRETNLIGDLSLNEVFKTQREKYTHFLAQPLVPDKDYNPWYTETKVKKNKVLSLKRIAIKKFPDEFAAEIATEVLKQKRMKMNLEDIKYFFSGIPKHYESFYQQP